VFSLIVLLVVLGIADRVTAAVAENNAASQIQSQGFPARPTVTIKGFPFLTQVAARDIGAVDISASHVPAGPVELATVTATATGIHLNSSYNGGVIDQVNGSALVTFASLAGAGTGGSGAAPGLTISAAGPDKLTISVGPLSEQAQVKASGDMITVQAVNNGDLVSGFLNSLGSLSFKVPPLPEGLQVTGVSVTQQGLRISAGAGHVQFRQ
jgi:hypothetical protein